MTLQVTQFPNNSSDGKCVENELNFQIRETNDERAERADEFEKTNSEDTVKLISGEGFEFFAHREAAMVSHTIRNMLNSPGGFAESQNRLVKFPEIRTTILEKICQYFYRYLQYSRGKESEFRIEPELTLELMMAANYLHT